jgi:hypothetical protein
MVDPTEEFKRYMAHRRFDRAWCAAQVLVVRGNAPTAATEFYEQYRPRGLVRPRGTLDGRLRNELRSYNEDPTITAYYENTWRELLARYAKPHAHLGLRRHDKRDVLNDPLMFTKLFVFVAQFIEAYVPELFLSDGRDGALLQLINASDGHELCPGLIARLQLFQGLDEPQVAFLLGVTLGHCRPAYLPAWALPAPEVDAGWRRAVEETAARGALLACSHLGAAVSMAPHLRDHLFAFALSEPYFAAREQLGMTIAG